jgi:hypothetical protein
MRSATSPLVKRTPGRRREGRNVKGKLIQIESRLESSADRALSPAQLQADPELVAQGWERRFTADEPRAKEAIELYEKLGYEVRAEPVRPEEFDDDCGDCRTVVAFHFLAIYTRRKSP